MVVPLMVTSSTATAGVSASSSSAAVSSIAGRSADMRRTVDSLISIRRWWVCWARPS
jgi:hypothetical protein